MTLIGVLFASINLLSNNNIITNKRLVIHLNNHKNIREIKYVHQLKT